MHEQFLTHTSCLGAGACPEPLAAGLVLSVAVRAPAASEAMTSSCKDLFLGWWQQGWHSRALAELDIELVPTCTSMVLLASMPLLFQSEFS